MSLKNQLQNQANTIRKQRKKIEKLKRLMLLTDTDTAHIVATETQVLQWQLYIKEFEDEA